MWLIGLAALGFVAYELFLKHFAVRDGVESFTESGQKAALKILHAASAALPQAGLVIPNAATFQVVQFQPAGLSAEGVVNSAATRGGFVLLTKNVFQSDGQPVLIAIVADKAFAKQIAPPGSHQFALLAPL